MNLQTERWAPASGILFVVLVAIAFALFGQPPGATESDASIVAYFKDNHEGMRLASFLAGLALVPFLWFLGSLRDSLNRAHAERLGVIMLAGGVAMAGGIAACIAIGAAAAGYANEVGNVPVVRALFDLSNSAWSMTAFPHATFVLAASLAMVRTGAVSKYLGWAGLIIGVLLIISGASIFTETGILAYDGAVTFVSFLLFLVWMLATSVMLTLRPAAVAAAVPAAARTS